MSFKTLLRFALISLAVSQKRSVTEAHPLTSVDSDCSINVKTDFGEPQPLLLDSQTDEFLFPSSSDGKIEFSPGETVKLFCSHGFRAPFDGEKSIEASCVAGRQFKVDNNVVDFFQIVCIKLPEHSARRTNQTCSNGIIVEIGFQMERKWLQLMRVCHNETFGSTNWVHYQQIPANRAYQQDTKRPNFIQAAFYAGLKVDNLYRRDTQRDTCSGILQSETMCLDLIANDGNTFLARGHLAARSDFIYRSHQRATFYFINVAPQWQSFNGGNWAVLEEQLKHYIDRCNMYAQIYTGTFGTLQYHGRNRQPQDMFLLSNSMAQMQKIPVPKIFYKIVVTDDNSGIVFIGVNNPHASKEEIKQNYIFCENVIPKVHYIAWKDDVKMGHMYACSIDEFVQFVENAPNLPRIDRILL